jgi:tRNA isopentenyl-2-thiomethyl-A-37 hydroxylase MiaE
VRHNDRDIEFIQFKRWLERLYSGTNNGTNNEGSQEQSSTDSEVLLLDYKSCEMIADELYEKISAKYPGRFVEIEVSEDGENGCLITYPKM